MENSTSHTSPLQQAFEWLLSVEKAVKDEHAQALVAYWRDRHFNFPLERCQYQAETTMKRLLKRLSGSALPLEEFKVEYQQILKTGLSADDITGISEVLLEILIARANKELASKPQVRDELISTARYSCTFNKIAAASAVIESMSK
ncbi:MAG TPA: hypothetical protein VH186_27920 [Chloroflexia bacterium]|nr:hypothetical protein [Chloroflexia bacterium]